MLVVYGTFDNEDLKQKHKRGKLTIVGHDIYIYIYILYIHIYIVYIV